jgi:OPA family glycerol-3-phosphate transporter-like MFS transporter
MGEKNTEFLRQRLLNIYILGLSYACFYSARYNLASSHGVLAKNLGWSYSVYGKILGIALLIYGISVFINGPVADKIGGKKSILLGAAGAFLSNLLFGASYYANNHQIPYTEIIYTGQVLIESLTVIWSVNYFFQAFGALSIVKINTAWFQLHERGTMSAKVGFLIHIGRLAVLAVIPYILLKLPWPWAFFIPAIALLISFFAILFFVKERPEDIGVVYFDKPYEHLSTKQILKKVFTSKVILMTALLAFCLGGIRNGLEHWVSRFFVSRYELKAELLGKFAPYNMYSILMPASLIVASLIAGPSSQKYFQSRRYPLITMSMACILYLLPIFSLLIVSPLSNAYAVCIVIVLTMFFSQIAHSLLMGSLCADIAGRSATASTAGFFDGMSYAGGAAVSTVLSIMLDLGKDKSLNEWYLWPLSLILFAAVGSFVGAIFWNKRFDENK